MKKKLIFLLISMLLILISSLALVSVISEKEESKSIKVVTSFYPMYILTENVIGEGLLNDKESDIELVNLTSYQSGCLHDYQITTDDMRMLEDASVLVVNGGGMEAFLDDIEEAYPDLYIINASEAIPMLEGFDKDHSHAEDHNHEEDHEGHNHEHNAHVWLNMDYYGRQIENVAKALSEFDPFNKSIYRENSEKYQKKIKELQIEIKNSLKDYKSIPVIIFHDAFVYTAKELGLNIVHVVDIDENSATSLNARQVGEIINIVNEHDVRILLSEGQYSEQVVKTVADETNAKVYVVDTLVTGDEDIEAYQKGMKENLKTLETAFEENKTYYE